MNLLNSLESSAGKKAYQVFEVRLGIDTFLLQVPLQEAARFQEACTAMKSPSKEKLTSMAVEMGGRARYAPLKGVR